MNANRRTLKPANPRALSRRKFMITGGAAATAFAVVPRHVLGGAGFVAPNEKIAMAYIGCGTQGLREMLDMLKMPEVQIVAVCDPIRDSNEYVDWSPDGLRSSIAQALGNPDWRKAKGGIPGGREVGKEIVEAYYAKARGTEKFKGCTPYLDFRELLEAEKDVNAVKVMTPDHLHATVAIAAMKKGKHTITHKPLANRLNEARMVIEVARATKVGTHFLAASDGSRARTIKAWIDAGAIGKLREIHNWSNRPVWPQYPTLPTDTPPIPEGFDWNLWLGPSLDRPYHPHYTHTVFRGWYEFGGGAIADMGHYSLLPVFNEFQLDAPYCVESRPAHVCTLKNNVAVQVRNDYSFPAACTVRLRFAAKADRPALDLYWYDGSMRPRIPEELEEDQKELEAEGMMFVGDEGKILTGFLGENPTILPAKKGKDFQASKNLPAAQEQDRERTRRQASGAWVEAFRGGKPTFGDFALAGPISDAFNLAAVSLRMGGKTLRFDASAGKVTNLPDANKYLGREYRKGWELTV